MSTSSENTGSLASMADPNASTVDTVPIDANTSTVPAAQPPLGTQPASAPPAPPVPAKMQMVRLSSKRTEEALPEGRVNIGRVSMEIPSAELQTAGFELTKEQAAVLVPQFNQYKFVTEKGTKAPSVNL